MQNVKKSIFNAVIPAEKLTRDHIEYYIQAEDDKGNKVKYPEHGSIKTCIYDNYRTPVIAEHIPVEQHRASPIELKIKLDDDSDLAFVKVHYRTLDQNTELKEIKMKRTGEKEYSVKLPAKDLTPLYKEMYSFEAVNKNGNGSFYPDPYTKRYFVINITK